MDAALPTNSSNTEVEIDFHFSPRDGGQSPFKGLRCSLIVNGNMAYFLTDCKVYSYRSSTGRWNTRPPMCTQVYSAVSQWLVGIIHQIRKQQTSWFYLTTDSGKKIASGLNIFQPCLQNVYSHTTASIYKKHLINYCWRFVQNIHSEYGRSVQYIGILLVA